MPGLFGLARLDAEAPLERELMSSLLDEMADRLQHVGREKMQLWADWSGGVVVARLGLDELPAASWPASPAEETKAAGSGATGRRHVFVDGILHADSPSPEDLCREADPSDAEIARRLEGFWSAVLYRPATAERRRRLSIVVDRRAQRQLFWTVKDGILFFAPEVKALLAVPGIDRSPDSGSMGIFFASGFLPVTQTFFRDIHRLEGGSLVTLEGDEPRIETYAEYKFTVDGDGTPYEELRAALGRRMREAVARNYTDPEHDLVFLSGGKDSRCILAAAVDTVEDPSRVRAVSWTSNDPQPGSDVYIAKQIADHLGVQLDIVRRTTDDFHRKALRLNYVLDGLTDVGAYHGEELGLMEELAGQGIRKVLRGDQCFTRGRSMLSPAYAILRMCLRSTSGLGSGRSFWQPDAYREVCEAGDADLAAIAEEYTDVQEDNVGDQVYFRHRLQGYLNSAVYFKHLVLDHRNPLLDEGLLRLIQRMSVAARREQKILNEGGSLAFADVWNRFPFAERSNLEDYVDLLARDTPVRRMVRRELEDTESAVWQYLDRRALLGSLGDLRSSGGSAGWKARLKKTVKTTVAKAVYDIPAVDVRLRGRYLRRETRPDEVLLRAVTLKHVFDLFVSGDGSRKTFDSRRARLEADHA